MLRDKEVVREKIARLQREPGALTQTDEVKGKNWRECPLAGVTENMILGEDIEAEEGTILLRKGTVLTKMMIFRLRELAAETDSSTSLWVGEPG